MVTEMIKNLFCSTDNEGDKYNPKSMVPPEGNVDEPSISSYKSLNMHSDVILDIGSLKQ